MRTKLNPADRRDFEETLRRFKRSPSDFDLLETGDNEVTVRERKLGTERIYTTGMGIWLSEFKGDLFAGVFGWPTRDAPVGTIPRTRRGPSSRAAATPLWTGNPSALLVPAFGGEGSVPRRADALVIAEDR
jgi:hypothetical protein